MRALDIAATGMLAQQLNVEVISNNIANLQTTGYKKQRAEFKDLLYQNQLRVGTVTSDSGTVVPTGIQLGLGVAAGAVYRNMSQGNLTNTGNKFDVAISGKGFFKIVMPDGSFAYTRAGSFQVNATGQIVTAEGYTVSPGINIAQDTVDVTINQAGQVISTNSSNTQQTLGQLDLDNFINEAGLQAQGDNLYTETVASGAPIGGFANDAGFGSIKQGFLEASNSDPVTEITSLITAQRSYEMNSKVIQSGDQMLQTLSQLQ